jgi:hypothetical protein
MLHRHHPGTGAMDTPISWTPLAQPVLPGLSATRTDAGIGLRCLLQTTRDVYAIQRAYHVADHDALFSPYFSTKRWPSRVTAVGGRSGLAVGDACQIPGEICSIGRYAVFACSREPPADKTVCRRSDLTIAGSGSSFCKPHSSPGPSPWGLESAMHPMNRPLLPGTACRKPVKRDF